MKTNKTMNNLISGKSVAIVVISLCVGILLSCSSGDVGSPDFNFSTGGIKFDDPKFTAKKTYDGDFPIDNHIRVNVEAIKERLWSRVRVMPSM